MLFDLRSRSRRTTVRVVYGTLAVIFALTFVIAGVGLGANLNFGALFGEGGSTKTYGAEVAKAKRRAQREPNSAAAWATLTEAQLRQSSEPEYSNQSTGGFTSKGKKFLGEVQRSWEEYLVREPKNPSPQLAHRMINVLGEGGAESAPAEVRALQIVIAAQQPSDALYAELAQYSYQAGNKRQAELAGEKALELTPQSERARLKGELATLKKNGGHATTSAAETAEGGE